MDHQFKQVLLVLSEEGGQRIDLTEEAGQSEKVLGGVVQRNALEILQTSFSLLKKLHF